MNAKSLRRTRADSIVPQPQSQRRRKHRIVVLGEEGVGKSALTIQYVQNLFVDYHDPTLEEEYTRLTTIDEVPVELSILDTAGQDEVARLREQHVRQADGLVLVYSLTDSKSYERLHRFATLIERTRDYAPVPIVLVGNKDDLVRDVDAAEEEGRRLAGNMGCPFVRTSARLRRGVDEAFAQCVREIRRQERICDATTIDSTPTAKLLRRKSIRMIRSVSRRIKRSLSRQQ
ncbi:ras-like protein 1 [Oscarella lobularis]|uniref:ras-like protein 1 n=1 Tax=Oscarella lobularis TaxID=121494 RepID=UPI003313E4E8